MLTDYMASRFLFSDSYIRDFYEAPPACFCFHASSFARRSALFSSSVWAAGVAGVDGFDAYDEHVSLDS